MADLLEEDLTDEELRKLLEDELAAREAQTMPQPRFDTTAYPATSASTPAQIDEYNQQAVMPVPEISGSPEAWASPQYRAQVQRAIENSGFINADVGPGGNVITPGRDPYVENLRARRQAEQFAAMQEFESLVQGGATREEALARIGPQLFNASTSSRLGLLGSRAPKQFGPIKAQPLYDSKGNEIGNAVQSPGGAVQVIRPPAKTEPKMSPEQTAAQKVAYGRVEAARQALNLAEKNLAIDPKNAELVNKAILKRELLRQAERNYQAGAAIQAPPMPAAAPLPEPPRPVVTGPNAEGGFTIAREGTIPFSPKQLDAMQARAFLKAAGGDKAKARKLAKEAGYSF